MSHLRPIALILFALLATGCGGGGEAENPADKGHGGSASLPELPTEITGRWLLRLTNFQLAKDIPTVLIDVDDDGEAVVMSTAGLLTDAKDVELDVDATTFRMSATIVDDITIDVVGTLHEGIVRGNAARRDQPVVWPIRLFPTNAEELEGIEAEDTAGGETFRNAVRQSDAVGLEDFVEKRRRTPLALVAAESLIYLSARNAETADEFDAHIERYENIARQWGDLCVQYARYRTAVALNTLGRNPATAHRTLDELSDESRSQWAEAIDELKHDLDILAAQIAIGGDDDEARNAARETLREVNTGDPTDVVTTYALAEDARERGDDDEALALYGELVALPGLELQLDRRWTQRDHRGELPSDRFSALWEKVRPDADEDERTRFLDDVYAKRALYFASTEDVAPAEGNRVVLVEMFTGAQCAPCMGADLALSAVERRYGTDDLVALRYHQHLSRQPDPFANPTTESRFHYYVPENSGTPTVIVNGTMVSPKVGTLNATIIGRQLLQAPAARDNLLGFVEPELLKSTDLVIDLEAVADDRVLNVKANVTGLPDPVPETWRLRVVVAEREAAFASPNGVRRQEMIVRWMLPDLDGVEPTDGHLSFEDSADLPDLRRQIVDALDDYEESENVFVRHRPMDFESFVVVALVQDEDTKEVLQARAVPLTGTPVFVESNAPSSDSPEND